LSAGGPKNGRAQVAAALLLAAAAGAVDAVSFLFLHQTFTANMTGNATQLGIAVGHTDASAVRPLAIAVGTFVVAIWLATAGIEAAVRRGGRATAAPALIVEAALLGGFVLARPDAPPAPQSRQFGVMLVLAVAAMGVQTATFARALGTTVRTTYISGMLTTIVQEAVRLASPPKDERPSYLRDELAVGGARPAERLALHVAVCVCFLGGAVWGAVTEPRGWSVAAALAAVLVVAAIDLARPIHGHGR